jgi:hypothetical protein
MTLDHTRRSICRRGRRIAIGIAASAAVLTGLSGSASASATEIVREYRVVPGAGVFTTCADGSDVTFTSLSYRDYTTWLVDGVPVREHRHLTFDGTLTRGDATLGYTGVWNRDQDLVTGDIRITGGQFRVDLPSGGTLLGAGLRAEGNEFVGTDDRFLTDLCTALGA